MKLNELYLKCWLNIRRWISQFGKLVIFDRFRFEITKSVGLIKEFVEIKKALQDLLVW